MQEILHEKHIIIEKIMLGLRCSKGICVREYKKLLQGKQQEHFFHTIEQLQYAGLLVVQNDVVRLTARGYALENEVAVRLFPDECN